MVRSEKNDHLLAATIESLAADAAHCAEHHYKAKITCSSSTLAVMSVTHDTTGHPTLNSFSQSDLETKKEFEC